MGGDQLVEAVAGAKVEETQGDDVRAAEQELYGQLIRSSPSTAPGS
jgi:hypothetical protein